MSGTTLVRLTLVCGIVLATGGCVRVQGRGVSVSVPVPSSMVMESTSVAHTVPVRAGQLTAAQLDSIAPFIHSLSAEPPELLQLVGDTVNVSALVRIIALDSAGSVLGELSTYDFGFSGRGFRLLADGRLHLGRAGTVRFTARLPKRHWAGREGERPAATVAVQVQRAAAH